MLEGMYSAAAGMAAQQQRLDAVANDLANVNTTGYKPVRIAFRDLVYGPAARGASPDAQIGSGAAAVALGRSFAQGTLKQTGEPLDVGIEGPGYIAVRGADGRPALTRDGQLRVDAQGRIGTHAGALLDPPVRLPDGVSESELKIASDGTITARNARVGQIRLVTVPAPASLESGDGNLFRPNAASGAPIPAARTTRIAQGVLEGSGVDIAQAMTDLTVSQRAYQLASRAIQTQDQLAEIANGIKR